MATLTVGHGNGYQFQTIAAAVAASSSGDTVLIAAGNYVGDYPPGISHDLTIESVGGQVNMIAKAGDPPPNGKGILDIGGPGVSITIQGISFRDAAVNAGNGAGIRYEGGNLTLIDDRFVDDQDGLLANADPNGNITISGSVFNQNGSGSGLTHNIYVNQIATLTLENSQFLGAVAGHEIKSRAATTIIKNNVIADGASGTASYSIDLPNGGNATISHNVIEKGPNSQNPAIISYGEEGASNPGTSLVINANQVMNDDQSGSATMLQNDTSATAQITGNSIWGLTQAQIAHGPATETNNTILAADPARSVDTSPTGVATPAAAQPALLAAADPAGLPGQAASGNQTLVPAGTQTVNVAAGATVSADAGVPELFRITAGTGGHDLILNFQPGVDHLRLAGFGAGAEQSALAGALDSPRGMSLQFGDGTQVTLAGVHAASASLFG
jgi:hypothetical protein